MRATILFFVWATVLTAAQEPTGMIEGVVRDSAGGLVPGASIKAKSTTLQSWPAMSNEDGHYSIARLPAGVYRVSATVPGFQTSVKNPVVVETGITTPSVDFKLLVGEVTTSITVGGALPLLLDDSFTVGGTITPDVIQHVPLNGRSVLELGKTQPGVREATRSFNRSFLDILGAPQGTVGRASRYTMDGVSNMAIGNGGSVMNFSTEAVREVRISTADWDLSVGSTLAGSFSAVTQQGGNDIHGSAFYFFRDHNLGAHPALIREPANPDPFFQRRQFGLTGSGPIRRQHYFVFGSWERNEQRGVSTTTLAGQDFEHFSRITSSPFYEDLASVRTDANLPRDQKLFFRYSHDGGWSFEPGFGQQNTFPSRWSHNTAKADQWVLGLNSPKGQTLVNSLRASYFSTNATRGGAQEEDCAGCLGVGAPAINIAQAGFFLGNSEVNITTGQRLQISDSLMWQRGNHRAVFGMDWEHNQGGPLDWRNEPAMLTLYSPSSARQNGIPVPAEFNTLDDILRLPLRSVAIAVGDARVPQANGRSSRTWDTLRLYFQDTWRIRPRLALNYGLAWNIDRNLNYDLTLPGLLAPIVGEDSLGKRHKEWTNFSPLVGLTWRVRPDGNTVVRVGGARFFDFLFPQNLDAERAALGPPGVGRQNFLGASIPNLLPGVPGVPIGTPLDFTRRPTPFTGADLLTILPATREFLVQDLQSLDSSIQQFQITKTGGLLAPEFPRASAFHANAGISHRFSEDFVVEADFAFKHFSQVGIGPVDMNLSRSVRGPALPPCADDQKTDPFAQCANGSINMVQPVGRATYRGLLVSAEKRLSRRIQFLGSWAFSRNTGTSDAGANGFNLENWHENQGPLPTDMTHIFNFAGMAQMPRKFEVGFNFSYLSAPPFSAYLSGFDFNGDGFNGDTTLAGDLLPGSTVNVFNRGMGLEDLPRLVDQFNQAYAGRPDAQGVHIPAITLPGRYTLGDNFHSLDLRLSRTFKFRERVELTLIGDVFNVYNAANLSGYSGNLTNAATFGQPTARSSQVFGSGGPRAFQLALRARF